MPTSIFIGGEMVFHDVGVATLISGSLAARTHFFLGGRWRAIEAHDGITAATILHFHSVFLTCIRREEVEQYVMVISRGGAVARWLM